MDGPFRLALGFRREEFPLSIKGPLGRLVDELENRRWGSGGALEGIHFFQAKVQALATSLGADHPELARQSSGMRLLLRAAARVLDHLDAQDGRTPALRDLDIQLQLEGMVYKALYRLPGASSSAAAPASSSVGTHPRGLRASYVDAVLSSPVRSRAKLPAGATEAGPGFAANGREMRGPIAASGPQSAQKTMLAPNRRQQQSWAAGAPAAHQGNTAAPTQRDATRRPSPSLSLAPAPVPEQPQIRLLAREHQRKQQREPAVTTLGTQDAATGAVPAVRSQDAAPAERVAAATRDPTIAHPPARQSHRTPYMLRGTSDTPSDRVLVRGFPLPEVDAAAQLSYIKRLFRTMGFHNEATAAIQSHHVRADGAVILTFSSDRQASVFLRGKVSRLRRLQLATPIFMGFYAGRKAGPSTSDDRAWAAEVAALVAAECGPEAAAPPPPKPRKARAGSARPRDPPTLAPTAEEPRSGAGEGQEAARGAMEGAPPPQPPTARSGTARPRAPPPLDPIAEDSREGEGEEQEARGIIERAFGMEADESPLNGGGLLGRAPPQADQPSQEESQDLFEGRTPPSLSSTPSSTPPLIRRRRPTAPSAPVLDRSEPAPPAEGSPDVTPRLSLTA